MECNHRILKPEQLMKVLPDLLEEGVSVPLVISGNSMYPFLKHGRDTVYLSKPERPIREGDMVLYRRRRGEPVLHRVVSVTEKGLTLLGDRQTGMEPGIRPDCVLAVVTAVRRKGRLIKPGYLVWFFFAKIWPKLLRFRPRLIQIYSFMTADKEI